MVRHQMSAIAADLTGSLAASGYGSDERRVSATVVSGIVTLDGRVQRAGDVEAVCRLAWLVPGVVDVVHHLTVGVPESPTGRSERRPSAVEAHR